MKRMLSGFLEFVIVLILVSCAPAGAQGAGAPTQAGSYPTAGTVGGGPTAYPVPLTPTAAYPAPGATPGGPGNLPEGKTVTMNQNGKTVNLRVGETFLLMLGETYQWNIQIDPPAGISRIPNIAVIKGAQGLYTAKQPGTVTLSADGDPLCRQSKPACMMPSVHFSTQIVIQP